jgi:hypothetical protein
MTAMLATILSAAAPAGGAAIDQVVIATTAASAVSALLLWLCVGHRSGRSAWLERAGERARHLTGLPPWAALPSAVATVSLLVALLGMYWDIALHIDQGRDAGPLANPAHYLILAGLYGVFSAGVLAIAMPRGERPGPAPIRMGRDWYAPVGGVLMAACGGFALLGFPLDDVWHRLFGQDVTLWGPTHLMLIGGAGMSLVGQAVLLAEGMGARETAGTASGGPAVAAPSVHRRASLVVATRRMALMGGFLIGLSTFQAEFDFGVAQYRFVFQPFLIALAAGFALVAGRLWVGRGGALGAALFFLAVRGIVSLLVGPVLGQSMPVLPLYLGTAVLVELAGLALARRPLAFGAVAGVLAGTAGLATEWAWSQAVMPLPWTGDLLPEAIVFGVAGGVAGGLAGALLATGLRGELPRRAIAAPALALAGLAVAAGVADGLRTSAPDGATATVRLEPGGQAVVRFDPPDYADGAGWATMTSWQGGGRIVDRLEPAGGGAWRTTEPMPLHGDWKTILRVQRGRAVMGVPVRLPADPAIPARAVPATATFTRPFQRDMEILQRERRPDIPGWLWATASGVVLALYLAFLAALAWGVARVARGGGAPVGAPRRRFARGTTVPAR